MSTHAAILYQHPISGNKSSKPREKTLNSGSICFSGIYCHADGYPEWVGRVLLENYTTPEKVLSLIQLGDLESLGRTTEPEPKGYKSYEHIDPKDETNGLYTSAFSRDSGEKLNITIDGSYKEVLSKLCYEFAYLFKSNDSNDGNGSGGNGSGTWYILNKSGHWVILNETKIKYYQKQWGS